MPAPFIATLRSFSFGITMMLSHSLRSSFRPSKAVFMRFFISILKGVVTIAIVKAPTSFAAFAITGAAPVPVPPPKPAEINTRFAPSKTFVISS